MAENKWSNNNDSWKVSTDINDYFGVETTTNNSITEDAKNYFSLFNADADNDNFAFKNVKNQAMGVLNGITTLGDQNQYLNLGNAVLTSVSNASYDVVRKLFESLTQTQTITINSLMQEIAPYAADFKSAGKELVNTAKKYANKFTNISELLSPIISDVMNDSSVVEAISDLSIVQTYAATLNTASEVIDGVERVVRAINPLLPIVRMVSNFALSFWSGGTTAAEESTNIIDDLQKMLLQLSSVAMYYIKKYVYGIKIKVPKILVSSINTFSVKNAVGNFNMNDNWSALASTLFNDDYYNTAMIENSRSNTKNTAWLQTIENVYEDSMAWSKNQIALATSLGWKSSDPDSWWSRYRSSFVTSFMSKAIKDARSNVYSTSYSNFDTYMEKIKRSDYGQNNEVFTTNEVISTTLTTWNGIIKTSKIIFDSFSGVN